MHPRQRRRALFGPVPEHTTDSRAVGRARKGGRPLFDRDHGLVAATLGLVATAALGACSPPVSQLTVHNRTTGPVVFKTFVETEPEYVAGCESATYKWTGSWTRTDPSARPSVEPSLAITFTMRVIPPPDSAAVGTVIVSQDGAASYTAPDTIPSLPPCEGLAPEQ